MKKIDLFVLRSALGPFLVTLIIANFVFFIMILYTKLDDIIGKGLDVAVILEFFMHISLVQIPRSLPLAVLIASVMTMGNLGESYELVAIKSAGISLFRAMRPLIITSIIMAFVAFYFSNDFMPYSLKKMNALRHDIKNKKPTMLLTEGVFFNDFDRMTIKIEGKKDSTLYGLTIYDHRKTGSTKVIKADSAFISNPDSVLYMKMHLMDGKLHEDANRNKAYTRFGFETLDLIIDMSAFELGNTDDNLFSNNAKVKRFRKLVSDINSFEEDVQKQNQRGLSKIEQRTSFLSNQKDTTALFANVKNSENLLSISKKMYLNKAISNVRSIQNSLKNNSKTVEPMEKNILNHKLALYDKFALAFSCIVLFFIGAPMGALVRKGGFGMPILISILFYLLYYIINIVGKRMAEDGIISPLVGMWLSTIILFPIAIILTRMATADKKIRFIQ